MSRMELAMQFMPFVNEDLENLTAREAAVELGIDYSNWEGRYHLPQLVAQRCLLYLEAFENAFAKADADQHNVDSCEFGSTTPA